MTIEGHFATRVLYVDMGLPWEMTRVVKSLSICPQIAAVGNNAGFSASLKHTVADLRIVAASMREDDVRKLHATYHYAIQESCKPYLQRRLWARFHHAAPPAAVNDRDGCV